MKKVTKRPLIKGALYSDVLNLDIATIFKYSHKDNDDEYFTHVAGSNTYVGDNGYYGFRNDSKWYKLSKKEIKSLNL